MQWYNYDNSTDRYTELFTGLNIMREKKEGISVSLKIIRSNSEDIGAEVFVEAEQKLLSPDISEDKIRSFYKDHLLEAKKNSSSSIAFPLVPFGLEYACEEGVRIAADEIKNFLKDNEDYEMTVMLIAPESSGSLSRRTGLDIDEYIHKNYMRPDQDNTMGAPAAACYMAAPKPDLNEFSAKKVERRERKIHQNIEIKGIKNSPLFGAGAAASALFKEKKKFKQDSRIPEDEKLDYVSYESEDSLDMPDLDERVKHTKDTFSEYLMYLIDKNGLKNAEVYKNALIDKKIFSKIKNDKDYHPKKITAMCLCVGARLNLDETKDLLARAGYALSPCDKTDIIFSYFIENEIYDMIELDIKLEEYGLPCLIA